jgi:hypothetical protein
MFRLMVAALACALVLKAAALPAAAMMPARTYAFN